MFPQFLTNNIFLSLLMSRTESQRKKSFDNFWLLEQHKRIIGRSLLNNNWFLWRRTKHQNNKCKTYKKQQVQNIQLNKHLSFVHDKRNESKYIGNQIRFSNGNKTISIYKKKDFFSLLTPYLNVGFAVWPMTVRMSEAWREKVSLDSRRVYCRRSSNRVCFLHVTVGCGVSYGHFWWTFLCKQEWVVKMGSSCLFSEVVEIPIRQSWGKITTSENPKCVGLHGKVCDAALLHYNPLIISEEVEIPN